MAHLDVAERKIEATIAYIGPGLAGRSTNLQRLVGDGTLSSETEAGGFDWRPVGLTRFDDCDVSVRLVAPQGPISDDGVLRLVDAADGLVLVLDADPSAQDANREWLGPVRKALAQLGKPAGTVVVQFNKTDLPNALQVDQLRDTLDVAGWPHVEAVATRGEGVMETVRCALEGVLSTLEGGQGRQAEPGGSARADIHPLLSALRQVLRESIEERVVAMEERLDARLTESLEQWRAALQGQVETSVAAGIAGERAHLQASLEKAHAELDARLTTSRAELATELQAAFAGARREGSAMEERLSLAVAAASIEGACRSSELAETEARLAERLDKAAGSADVEAAERRLRAEFGTASRAEREHVTAAVTSVRKAIEALRVDLRPVDHTAELEATKAELQLLRQLAEESSATLVPTAAAVRALPAKLDEVGSKTASQLGANAKDLARRLEEAKTSLHVRSGEESLRLEERVTHVQAAIDELLEELKKRKKGWFG